MTGLSFAGLANLIINPCFAACQSILATPVLFIHGPWATVNFAIGGARGWAVIAYKTYTSNTTILAAIFLPGVKLCCSNLGLTSLACTKLAIRKCSLVSVFLRAVTLSLLCFMKVSYIATNVKYPMSTPFGLQRRG